MDYPGVSPEPQSLQRERLEELRKEAERLAEERRLAREQALEWTANIKEDSDDERERRPRKAAKKDKVKAEGGSGDEAGEPKKRRRNKPKKEEDGEDAALFSDQEDVDKSVKKVRIVTPLTAFTRLMCSSPNSEATRSGLFVRMMRRKQQVHLGRSSLNQKRCCLTRTMTKKCHRPTLYTFASYCCRCFDSM